MTATAKDKYGEEVKAEKYVLAYRTMKQTNTEPVTVNVTKAKAEPGEKINYDIKTGFDNIWLIHTFQKWITTAM